MKRPTNKTLMVLAGTVALGAGGATLGVAASGGGSSQAKELADALNKNEGTTLTQAQADQMLQRAKDAPKLRAAHEAARAARIAPVEKLLGMTADEIRAKLRDGTTLAKLAESKGVSRAKLLDAIKEGIIAAAKSEGVTFTAERLNEMAERMADRVGGAGRGGHRGPGGHGGFGPGGFGPGGPPQIPPLGP